MPIHLPKDSQSLLRGALLGNATFSAISGLLILIANRSVVAWLGLPQTASLLLLGIGLLAFAAGLVVTARRSRIRLKDAWGAVMMDLAWVVISFLLIPLAPFGAQGKWIVAAVADVVLLFAILQWAGIRRIKQAQQRAVPAG